MCKTLANASANNDNEFKKRKGLIILNIPYVATGQYKQPNNQRVCHFIWPIKYPCLFSKASDYIDLSESMTQLNKFMTALSWSLFG